jgi:hypothetical protein
LDAITNNKFQKIIDGNTIILNPLDKDDRLKIQKVVFDGEQIKKEEKSIPRAYKDAKIALTESGNLVQYGTYDGSVDRKITGPNPKEAIGISVHASDAWQVDKKPTPWKNFIKKDGYEEVKVRGDNILAHDHYSIYLNDTLVQNID